MNDAENAWRSDLKSAEFREQYIAARKDLLAAERLAADADEQPFAIEWQIDCEWPRMAQNAFMMTGSFVSVLTFDGSMGILQVVFQNPDAVRFSCVSDEVIMGHPLFGKGLYAYGLFKVMKSAWIDELRKCDSVHPQHDESHWKAAVHYLLCLKDRMCEVVTAREPAWNSFTTKEEALRASLVQCGLANATPDSPPTPGR